MEVDPCQVMLTTSPSIFFWGGDDARIRGRKEVLWLLQISRRLHYGLRYVWVVADLDLRSRDAKATFVPLLMKGH